MKNIKKQRIRRGVIGESEYQRLILSKFFKALLVINLVFFLIRISSELTVLIISINIKIPDEASAINTFMDYTLLLIEYFAFFLFYIRTMEKNNNKENLHIIRTWFFSYVFLSILRVFLIHVICDKIFMNKISIMKYLVFCNGIPHLYLLLSSILIANAIFQVGIYLNSRAVKIAAIGYPLPPLLIILVQALIISPRFSATIDITIALYNMQYFFCLFALYRELKKTMHFDEKYE